MIGLLLNKRGRSYKGVYTLASRVGLETNSNIGGRELAYRRVGLGDRLDKYIALDIFGFY